MSRSSTHNINNLISDPKDEIKSLLDRLAKIQALNNTLEAKLNATLSKHCRVINLRKNTLVIAASSPAWANKLRFQLTDLLAYFRESGYFGLANIEVIVQPR
ncbi:DciA family protein [Aliikangiella sp. IMCC44359]|uniref:DciA family protein n=1 Tax=Aliikangiella sp. IMCC44359 TaxID=3459125 RepID=UPI00403A9EB3